MRITLIILVSFCIMGLLFSACERKKTENYSGTLLNMPKRAEKAASLADLEALKSCVQAYRAANGKYPGDLKDAAALLGSPVDLGKYDYDPATGTVTMKN